MEKKKRNNKIMAIEARKERNRNKWNICTVYDTSVCYLEKYQV
jgi:hypothetical protein